MITIKRLVPILISILIVSTSNVGLAQSKLRSYILSTASSGGTFYPVGVGVATLVKVKLQPKKKIAMSAITSAGSGENVKLLRAEEAQFAILQGLYGSYAWNGEGPYRKKQEFLRSVSMLWQNVEHMIINDDLVRSGNVSDLGRLGRINFSIGKKNSGTEGSGKHILEALSINLRSFNLVYKGYGASSEALQNGSIQGMNIPAGPPVGAITMAFAKLGDDIRILNFTDRQLRMVNKKYPIWTRYTIPKDTYPDQEKAVRTIAQPNFLTVHKDVNENDVYLITKTIHENLAFLNAIHKSTYAISLNKATKGLPVPLHPGAARYYREKGIIR